MRFHKAILCVFIIILPIISQPQTARAQWYAGTWDSTIYNRAEKPRTVAMRFEIRDSDSDIPVPNVQITLQGYYMEERVGRSGDDVGIPYEPQEKEFKLRATTNKDGVAVFALGWQKEYPWRTFFGDHAPRENRAGGGYSIKDSWIRAVDDIEKVQQIEIRHPRYNYKKIPYNFKHLIEFGQEKKSQMQRPELFDKFKHAWQKEIKRKDVKFFVLNLVTKFPDFQNKKCKRPDFFEKIRNEDWGTIYKKPYNFFSKGQLPQSECGPYFVYLFDELQIEKRTQEIEISGVTKEELEEYSSTGNTSEEEPREATWGCSSCGHVYHGKTAPNFCPECGKAWGKEVIEVQGDKVLSSNDQTVADDSPASGLLDKEAQLLKTESVKLSKLSLPSLKEIKADPAKLAKLVEKAGAMKNQLAITGIQALPMMDPDTGQMTTLDAYARKLAQDKQLGGSLGEDPIATSYMMLFDSNFLVDEARIIRLQDGRYVSLTEAIDVAVSNSDSGLDPEVLKKAIRTAASLHQASRLSNGQLMAKALTSFLFAVSEANAHLEPVGSEDNTRGSTETSQTSPREKTVNIGNDVTMEFVLIPAGSFYMGSPATEKHRDSYEGPLHRVRISKPFYMARFETTQDQYMAVTGKNPSHFSGGNLPVDSVTWDEAVAFCNKLGSRFRLPTEAEWEYACRAGTATPYNIGVTISTKQASCWAWPDNTTGPQRTTQVGSYSVNAFGLYDMHGNVREWCSDWYSENYYSHSPSVDPRGPTSSPNNRRITRGGSWGHADVICRSASRYHCRPDKEFSDVGFRVVLELN